MMGAESSNLRDLQNDSPYDLSQTTSDGLLKVVICPAKMPEEITKKYEYTTFTYTKELENKEMLQRQIEALKTNRHPGILKYMGTTLHSKRVVLVTEFCIPLEIAIQKQEKEEIYAGLYNILKAVIFLNEKGCTCHNNIGVAAVYVDKNGSWKLGCFDGSSKVSLLAKQSYINDVSGYANFALSVLDYLQDDSTVTKEFVSRLEADYAPEDQEPRGALKELLSDAVFSNPYIEVQEALQMIPLKTSSEKSQFFMELLPKLHNLSPSAVSRQLVPLLFDYIVLTDPAADRYFLSSLFASGNDYCQSMNYVPIYPPQHNEASSPQAYFVKHSLPLILSLFECRDIHIRLILIKYLQLFVDCIEVNVLQMEVLPQLLVGLQDGNDDIVAATFQALSLLIPILGGEKVVGSWRQALFFDRKPNFSRTSLKEKEEAAPYKTVTEVIASQSASKKSKDDIALERKKQREERERKREENRKLREQRKAEREAVKEQRRSTSSLDGTLETSSNVTNTTSEEINQVADRDSAIIPLAETCEPDWEGFDPSRHELEQDQMNKPTNFAPSHSLLTKDSILNKETLLAHDTSSNWDNWNDEGDTIDDVQNIGSRVETEVSPVDSWSAWDNNDEKESDFSDFDERPIVEESSFPEVANEIPVAKKSTSDVWDSWGDEENDKVLSDIDDTTIQSEVIDTQSKKSTSIDKLQQKSKGVANKKTQNISKSISSKVPIKEVSPSSKSSGKGMSLSSAKKINPTQSSESKSTPSKIKPKNKTLGSEFDIQIDSGKLRKAPEDDLFADMLASVDSKPTNTVLIEKPAVNTKFTAIESDLFAQDDSGGWDDDGW